LGENLEQTMTMIKEVIELYIESLKAHDEPIILPMHCKDIPYGTLHEIMK
jgi:predicted RNase H-like HicB family nuclease